MLVSRDVGDVEMFASNVRCGKLIKIWELTGNIGFTALEASEQIYSVATETGY